MRTSLAFALFFAPCAAPHPHLPATDFLPSPLARAVVAAPGQWRGFWYYDGREQLRAMRQAGANFVSWSTLWVPGQYRGRPDVVSMPSAHYLQGAYRLEQRFRSPIAFDAVGLDLFSREARVLIQVGQADHIIPRHELEVPAGTQRVFVPLGRQLPPGAYWWRIELLAGRADIWLRPAEALPTDPAGWLLLADNTPWPDVVADTWIRNAGAEIGLLQDLGVPSRVPLGEGYLLDLDALDLHGNLGLGTQNNAWFTWLPDWFWERFPDAAMLDHENRPFGITWQAHVRWPTLDHPAILDGARESIAAGIAETRHSRRLAYWVVGGESLHPTLHFPERLSDYSPPSLAHYAAWQDVRGQKEDPPRRWAVDRPTASFLHFREHQLAESFQTQVEAVRRSDQSRPALIPVHADIYGGHARRDFGIRPSLWAAMGDGFETGQIIPPGDPWRLNLRYFQVLGSFGLPIAAARLLERNQDSSGVYGFTPEGLRRIVYESVGSGAWHVGLVQWRGETPDGRWGLLGTPALPAATRVFRELSVMAPELAGCYPPRPDLAVYLSDETWLLSGFAGPWGDLHRRFAAWNLPVSYLGDDQLTVGDADRYPCMFAMDCDIVPAQARAALEAYVRAGGHLIIAGLFCRQDENLQLVPPFPAAPPWSPDWHMLERDADRERWALGAGTLTRIIHPDYARLPGILRAALAERGVVPPVQLSGPQEGALEALLLTDGLSPVVILINRTSAPQSTTIALSPAFAPRLPAVWWDLLSDRRLSAEAEVPIEVPAHEVAVVQARVLPDPPQSAWAQQVLSTSQDLAARRLETPLGAALRQRLAQQLDAQRYHKALATALLLNRQLGMRGTAQLQAGALHVQITLATPDGEPAAGARVQARFSPLEWRWWPLEHLGGATYYLHVPLQDLPPRYDVQAHRYRTWWGQTRIFVQAWKAHLEGEIAVDLDVPPDAAILPREDAASTP